MKSGRMLLRVGLLAVIFVALACPALMDKKVDLVTFKPNAADQYDPNETRNTAKTIAPGWTHNLTVNATDLYDWYKIYVSANYCLTVNMNWFVHYDLDLYLLNSGGTELDSSHANRLVLYENTSYDVRTAGTYYIHVEYWDCANSDGTCGEPLSQPLNYSLYVNNTGAISTSGTSNDNSNDDSTIIITIVLSLTFLSICIVAGVAASVRNKQKAMNRRPQEITPIRARAKALAPDTWQTAPPTRYEPPIPPKPLVRTELIKKVTAPRFCSLCHAEVEPTQRFCHNCGVDLEAKW